MSTQTVDADNLAKLLEKQLDGLDTFVTKEALKRIQRRTPVETGRAQRSWYITKGGIDTSDDRDKIEALEFGSSDQAPAGMIRVTAAETDIIIQEYAKRPIR